MSTQPHVDPARKPKRPLLALTGATVLTGLVIAFGPSMAQGSTGDQVRAGSAKVVSPASVAAGNAQAFSDCMRKHGVPDFPGVTIGAGGSLQLAAGSAVDPISKSYRAAAKACTSTLPSGTALPADPVVPAPSAPSAPLGIDCSGTGCPAEPKAPAVPALPK